MRLNFFRKNTCVQLQESTAYEKINKVILSCTTISQLAHTRQWMYDVYAANAWEREGAYYRTLILHYEAKWDILHGDLNEN